MPRDARPGKPAARLLGAALGLALLAAQLADLARGQSSPAAAPPAELAAPGLRAPTPSQPIEPLPDCDAIMIIGRQKCNFEAISNTIAQVTIKRPVATVFGTVDPALYTVPFGSNSLRRVMEETFPSNPAKPTSYAAPIPVVSVAVASGKKRESGSASLVPSRENSINAQPGPPQRYIIKVQRGGSNDDFAELPNGRCSMIIRAPCFRGCPEGQAQFNGNGKCVPATKTADVCPVDEAKFGDSTTCKAATPTADVCPEGEANFGDGCVAACPNGQIDVGSGCARPVGTCSYSDTACAEGSVCPGGTLVSAECADRTAFSENPCACTALQQLAALSPGDTSLQDEAPWDDLANAAYCQRNSQYGSLNVGCAPVGGVQLPTSVSNLGHGTGPSSSLPPSLGDLGPSLTSLAIRRDKINAVPTEIGDLTGLTVLQLSENVLTSMPTELGALTGLVSLDLSFNDLTSLPTDLGALTGLKDLDLGTNALTAVPAEIGALTSLVGLYLNDNKLTGVPPEFQTVNPGRCLIYNNPGFSCANVGAGTSCCTGVTEPGYPGWAGNNCGADLPGGPCYGA